MIPKNRKKGNTDPRYKNGVYANRQGQAAQDAADRTNISLKCHPLSNGWTFSHFDEKDRAVYSLCSFELRFQPDKGWVVNSKGSTDAHLYKTDWTVQDITHDLGLFGEPVWSQENGYQLQSGVEEIVTTAIYPGGKTIVTVRIETR